MNSRHNSRTEPQQIAFGKAPTEEIAPPRGFETYTDKVKAVGWRSLRFLCVAGWFGLLAFGVAYFSYDYLGPIAFNWYYEYPLKRDFFFVLNPSIKDSDRNRYNEQDFNDYFLKRLSTFSISISAILTASYLYLVWKSPISTALYEDLRNIFEGLHPSYSGDEFQHQAYKFKLQTKMFHAEEEMLNARILADLKREVADKYFEAKKNNQQLDRDFIHNRITLYANYKQYSDEISSGRVLTYPQTQLLPDDEFTSRRPLSISSEALGTKRRPRKRTVSSADTTFNLLEN